VIIKPLVTDSNTCARLINGPTFAGHIATWDRYDTEYYVEIAQYGYYNMNHQGVILANFFPLFPLAIWLVQHVTLLFEHKYSYLLAGLIVSNQRCRCGKSSSLWPWRS